MNEPRTVNVLDIDHVFSILAHLHRHDGRPVMATGLREVMPNYHRMMAIVRKLQRCGLVELRVETRPRRRYLISLTDKGRKVAGRLLALDGMIREL
jgi:DNA-binding MarR family transcriptional regulator